MKLMSILSMDVLDVVPIVAHLFPFAEGRRRKRCNGEDNACCTEDNPCTEGDGDCDNDDHCSGSLVCGNDNCAGHGFDGSDDCCTGKNLNQGDVIPSAQCAVCPLRCPCIHKKMVFFLEFWQDPFIKVVP